MNLQLKKKKKEKKQKPIKKQKRTSEKNGEHKATIETIINTTAIALTATGTSWVVNGFTHNGLGCTLIILGVGLEWFKYVGRKKGLW